MLHEAHLPVYTIGAKLPPATGVALLKTVVIILICVASPLLCIEASSQEASGTSPCNSAAAEFVSVEGEVELRRSGANDWLAAYPGLGVCDGDTIRVAEFGRGSIQLRDRTLLNLDRNTQLVFVRPEAEARESGSLLNLIRGIIHVISRDPRSLQFTTPFVNAGLEGTEFLVAVDDRESAVTVLEGSVSMVNERGQASVPAGSVGTATASTTPTVSSASGIESSLDWTAYFPAIIEGPLPAPDAAAEPAEVNAPSFFVRRAASRLRVGTIREAESDLDTALSIEPRFAPALALRSIIATVQQDAVAGRELAEDALALEPDSVSGLLALSYAAQELGDLEASHSAALRASSVAPGNPLAVTRLAETFVARGRYVEGRMTAREAIAIDPAQARAHTVEGFALLGERRTQDAMAAFSMAASLDPGLPLARVGLALARARDKELEPGREELEIGVMLDPRDALLRSYMAQLYETENRTELSAAQLALAKSFDPNDSTAWLYDALHRQQHNRPVEALLQLEASSELSDGVLPVRSNLRLHDDLATRSAGIGQMHRATGFERLGLLRGSDLVQTSPSEFAGYRLLADIYSALPRHQIARVKQLYQSQLLQPINVSPVQPQLSEANLFILDRFGPSELAFSDLIAPVNSNGAHLYASAIAGANETEGVDATVSGLHDKLYYSAGYFDYSTNGFRSNNDFDQQAANALFQFQANADTSLLFELRSSDLSTGDLKLLFDAEDYSDLFRREENVDSARFGFRHSTSERSTWLASVSFYDVNGDVSYGPSFSLSATGEDRIAEVQNILQTPRWNVVSGIRVNDLNREDVTRISGEIPFPPFEITEIVSTDADVEETSLYSYGTARIGAKLVATVGIEAISIDMPTDSHDEINPKLGLVWQLGERTKLRLARFETTGGPVISKFHIEPTLSPTNVASFNQEYFGSEGEQASQSGIALDHSFSPRLYAGMELLDRSVDVPVSEVDPLTGEMRQFFTNFDESIAHAYIYWARTDNVALTAEYVYEEFDNNGFVFTDGYALLETHRVPLTASFFHRSRLHARARATYIDQSGLFAPVSEPYLGPPLPGASDFWTVDLSVGYRFRNRRGYISLDVDNIFDERSSFQDTDPENPRLMPERMLALRFTLSY